MIITSVKCARCEKKYLSTQSKCPHCANISDEQLANTDDKELLLAPLGSRRCENPGCGVILNTRYAKSRCPACHHKANMVKLVQESNDYHCGNINHNVSLGDRE